MKRLPRISNDDINKWIEQAGGDARSWALRPGAPRHVVDAFPQLVDAMLAPDALPAATLRFDVGSPITADPTRPSTLFVRLWQLARDARNFHDEAIAIGLDKPLSAHLEAHAKALESLRDQVHDSLLTDEDKANGAVPRGTSQ